MASDPASLAERLRAARIDRPKDYHLLPISLAAARNNELIVVSGTSLQIVSETDSTVTLSVRLEGYHNDPVPLSFRQGIWGVPFTQFLLSNTAQAGKSCSLLIGTPAAGEVRIAKDSPPLDAANPGYVQNASPGLYVRGGTGYPLYLNGGSYWPGSMIESGPQNMGYVGSGVLVNPVAGTVLAGKQFSFRIGWVRAWISCDAAAPMLFLFQARTNGDLTTASEWPFLLGGNMPTIQWNMKPYGMADASRYARFVVGENITGRVMCSAAFTELSP